MQVFVRLLGFFGTQLPMSRAGMNKALLLAPEPGINTFFVKLVQNMEHVIYTYHWFTCILHPKGACLCLQRLGGVSSDLAQLSCNQTPSCTASPRLWIPHVWSGLLTPPVQALSAWSPWHKCLLFRILILRCCIYTLYLLTHAIRSPIM